MNTLVRVSHRFAAPAERVFDAWLTPSQASRFLFATRTGNIMRCQIEPWVGGRFTITDRRPQAEGDESVMDTEHHGSYVVIDRPRLLVFDFSVYGGETTRVTLDFRPLGATACDLLLTHEMGTSDTARAYEERSRQGWARMLATLERELFPKRVGFQL